MDRELEDYLARVLVSPIMVRQVLHAQESELANIVDAAGVEWFLKRHHWLDHYKSEVDAYRRWVPALGDRAPSLRSHSDDLQAIVLSIVPGRVCAVPGRASVRAANPDIQHQAGSLLRRFHDAEDFGPWDDMVSRKLAELDEWVTPAAALFEAREVDFVRTALGALAGVPPPALVPCHLDYAPINWLEDGGTLSVIDFGMARPEVWINDLGRLYFGLWLEHPGLQDAFLDGYGRCPDETDVAILRASYSLAALRNAVWAHAHGNQRFEEQNRRVLAGLIQGS
jgi:Ser/Thr protein kinase RdoA (MazF antagonist)